MPHARNCLTAGCRTLVAPPASRCSLHARPANATWSPGRTSTDQSRFARAVKQRDGHQCTAIENGVRCTATTNLRAHHVTPFRATGSYDPNGGVTLCAKHDRQADQWAR